MLAYAGIQCSNLAFGRLQQDDIERPWLWHFGQLYLGKNTLKNRQPTNHTNTKEDKNNKQPKQGQTAEDKEEGRAREAPTHSSTFGETGGSMQGNHAGRAVFQAALPQQGHDVSLAAYLSFLRLRPKLQEDLSSRRCSKAVSSLAAELWACRGSTPPWSRARLDCGIQIKLKCSHQGTCPKWRSRKKNYQEDWSLKLRQKDSGNMSST